MIIGNWKMYKTGSEAKGFIKELVKKELPAAARVHLAVPYPAIESAVQVAAGSQIAIGAQNMHDAQEGAYTGEVSARMLKECGATFVLLGHSERRRLFGESDAFINRKVHRALEEGLTPILCVGESAKERSQEKTYMVLEKQLEKSLFGVKADAYSKLIIAYEPVWAIGTGQHATPDQAQDAHRWIRNWLAKHALEQPPILYGGSVKFGNAKLLLQEKDVDGLLVGGASLNVETFFPIIQEGLANR